MNVTMFLMINLCVKVRRSNALMKIKDQVFTGKLIIIGIVKPKYLSGDE